MGSVGKPMGEPINSKPGDSREDTIKSTAWSSAPQLYESAQPLGVSEDGSHPNTSIRSYI
jgi:hypothetical protein